MNDLIRESATNLMTGGTLGTIALVCFVVAYVAVLTRTLWPGRTQEFAEAAQLPLADGPRVEPQSVEE